MHPFILSCPSSRSKENSLQSPLPKTSMWWKGFQFTICHWEAWPCYKSCTHLQIWRRSNLHWNIYLERDASSLENEGTSLMVLEISRRTWFRHVIKLDQSRSTRPLSLSKRGVIIGIWWEKGNQWWWTIKISSTLTFFLLKSIQFPTSLFSHLHLVFILFIYVICCLFPFKTLWAVVRMWPKRFRNSLWSWAVVQSHGQEKSTSIFEKSWTLDIA